MAIEGVMPSMKKRSSACKNNMEGCVTRPEVSRMGGWDAKETCSEGLKGFRAIYIAVGWG
jgi:hypothetical protein